MQFIKINFSTQLGMFHRLVNRLTNKKKISIQDNQIKFIGVGNGGLSLRKVESFLKVLQSQTIFEDNFYNSHFHLFYQLKYFIIINILFALQKKFSNLNFIKIFFFFYRKGNEDIFWSYYANFFAPSFKVANLNTALDFAYEYLPEKCYEYHNKKIPFGCHAWYKYNRDFWLSFLK